MNRFQNNEDISIYVCRGDVCNRISLDRNVLNRNVLNRENYGDEAVENISLDSIATRNGMGWMQLNNPITTISKSQQLTIEKKTLFIGYGQTLIIDGTLINLYRITADEDSKIIVNAGGKFCNSGSIETASAAIEVHGKFLNQSTVDLSDTKLTVAGVFHNANKVIHSIVQLNILPSGEFINYSGGSVSRSKNAVTDIEILGKNITYTNEQFQLSCDLL